MICPEMTIIPGPPNSALENWPVNPPPLIGRETEHKDLEAERCVYFSLTNSFNYCLELPGESLPSYKRKHLTHLVWHFTDLVKVF